MPPVPSGPDAADPVVVVLGGAEPIDEPWLTAALGARATVVAADSGLRAASALGVAVQHVVGDLDSIDPDEVDRAIAAGAVVHRHPADKDATDGELALALAAAILEDRGAVGEIDARRLVVVGGGGGRLDHLVADLLALVSDRLSAFEVTAHFGPATVTVVRPGAGRTIHGEPGELVSLLAPVGPATGITTVGLRWPLEDGDLAPGSTRGTSNQMEADEARVAVSGGVLVAIQPGAVGRIVEPRATSYDPSPRLEQQGSMGRLGSGHNDR